VNEKNVKRIWLKARIIGLFISLANFLESLRYLSDTSKPYDLIQLLWNALKKESQMKLMEIDENDTIIIEYDKRLFRIGIIEELFKPIDNYELNLKS
jgi:hypothetical protein